MNKKKYALNAAKSLLLTLFLVPSGAHADFSDVETKNPQYEAIMYLNELGILKGYEDGTFKPNALINKAEFLKMAFNHAGYYPRESFYQTPFTDFQSGAWFAPYVAKGLELELITFNPNWPVFMGAGPVERIEATKLLLPLEGIPTPYLQDTKTIFLDIDSDYKYLRLVQGAEKSGVYIEEETPVFLPLSPLTRGDAAELLYKADIYRNFTASEWSEPDIEEYLYYDLAETDLVSNDKFPILVSVWNKINEQYLNRSDIDEDELMYGAIGGMVDSLEDPYSVFEEPEPAGDLWDSLEGSYEGIGTVLDTFEDTYVIIGIIKNSPADKAGLKIGDTILTIDGKSFTEGQIEQLIDAIKGPAGTQVKIEIDRNGSKMTFTITREQITLDTVLLEAGDTDIPASLGYVAIYQFTDSTSAEFDSMITETMNADPQGLILDLRDNPGGYVDSAVEILGYFFDSGKTVAILQMGNEQYLEKSPGEGSLKDLPVAVLVNENTASAAEIVAGALREKENTILVGQTTFGKGTVQEVSIYTDGSLLKLSVAKWLTPSGIDIDHTGLIPDITVIPTKDDTLGKTDSQLARAIEELEKML